MKNIFCLRLLKLKRFSYIGRIQCKITELALTGYNYEGAYSPLWAFFMRKISMLLHLYVELGRDTFECAGSLCSQSVNLLKLHTNHLTVTCVALNYKGAHSS
jgi:hypothetical protein